MRNIYKLELMIAVVGILAISLSLLPNPTLTGYVSGLNITFYLQELNLIIEDSNSYTLTTASGNLHFSSFMVSGEIFGNGRVEVLIDNGKGSQYLVYENIARQKEYRTPNLITGIPITGKAIESYTEKKGIFVAVSKKQPINYEFSALNEGDEVLGGSFHSECIETCEIPENLFNSDSYKIVFRIEKGTSIRIDEIRYTLYE